MQVTVKYDAKQLLRTLDNVISGLKDYRNPLKKSGEYLTDDIRKNFDSEGAKYGKWKPLALYTQRDRMSKGFPPAHPILKRTGKLRGGNKTKVTKNTLEITNTVPYFKIHQLGGKSKTGKMVPQRTIFKLTDENTKGVRDIFGNYLVGIIKGTIIRL